MTRHLGVWTALLVGVTTAAGCGSSGRNSSFDDAPPAGTDPGTTPGEDGGGPTGPNFGTTDDGLTVDPLNAVVFIDTATTPVTPATLSYKVKLKQGGTETDLTSGATFELADKALGTFAGPTFTSVTTLPGGLPGATTFVKVDTGQHKGQASLTVVALRKTGDNRDFFFLEPYKQPPSPSNDVLKFSTKIQKVDVAFVTDTTGSMGGSITNLRSALTGTIVPALTAAIPSVHMAVVDHKDFPYGSYGDFSDFPVRVYQVMTPTVSLVSAGINKYNASGGFDGPESQIPAMQHTLTGEAISWPGGTVPAHTPPAGLWGGVDFRDGSVPVIVLITDVSWHDDYTFPHPTMGTLQAAFKARNAKFVDITNFDEGQANVLSDATSSNVPPSAFGPASTCPTGVGGAARGATGPGGTCRLNFLHSGGSGVSTGITKAIQAISVGSTYDVTAKPSNDPTNADGVDATKFMKALRAKDEGDATQGCPPAAAKDSDGDGIKDTFLAVKVGTPVCFEVIPQQNDTVPPKNVVQFFNAYIDVLGLPGNINLDKRIVKFLVPPAGVQTK